MSWYARWIVANIIIAVVAYWIFTAMGLIRR